MVKTVTNGNCVIDKLPLRMTSNYYLEYLKSTIEAARGSSLRTSDKAESDKFERKVDALTELHEALTTERVPTAFASKGGRWVRAVDLPLRPDREEYVIPLYF